MITYLYIIRAGLSLSDPVKIGVANNIEKRLDAMQTGNHKELVILYKIPMNSREHAFSTEKRIHSQFRKQNIRGEWFRSRVLSKIKIKELLSERNHEKLFDENDLEMICEANKHI